MIHYNRNIIKFAILTLAIVAMSGCTKLNEKLKGTLTSSQVTSALGSTGTGLLLSSAYADLSSTVFNPNDIFTLEEVTTDECIIPARGGDWDDNGTHRALFQHKWDANLASLLSAYNDLNKINFDATNVLGFNPSKSQAAEAGFLRAYSLYNLLSFFGQYPIRNPGDNLLLPPKVLSGADAIDSIIGELTALLPDLPASNSPAFANPDAAKVLLMQCYLNKGMFGNRVTPTFDPADMAQVISLGESIINSGKYSYTPNYFDNFSSTNHNSKEAIFLYPNTGGVSTNSSNPQYMWITTLHYNSYDKVYGDAGWNGYVTTASFYNSFNTTNTPTAFGPADTIFDTRLGGRVTSNIISTETSGIRPGFLVGQQYDEHGAPIKDRRGNLLIYNPTLSSDGFEKGNTLELGGIRVDKYPPDYDFYSGPAGNDEMIYRYPDVVLMVAEAKLRLDPNDASALSMVNDLRAARGAKPMLTIPLVNTSNVDDPHTLLAERGRELYWECFRRTDLLRFGVYLVPWDMKPTDDPKNLVFPIPSQALSANPNLKQNPGY